MIEAVVAVEDGLERLHPVHREHPGGDVDLEHLRPVRPLVQLERLDLRADELVSPVAVLDLAGRLDEDVADALPGVGIDLPLEGRRALLVGLREDDERYLALHVLESDDGHLVTLLGDLLCDAANGDHAGELDDLAVLHLEALGCRTRHRVDVVLRGHRLGYGAVAGLRQRVLERAQRVVRYVESEDVVLLLQLEVTVPLVVGVRVWHVVREARASDVREHVEHGHLPVCLVLLALRRRVDDVRGVVLVHELHELLARIARLVEGSGLDEGLDHPSVRLRRIDALAEVVQVLERAVRGALRHDCLGWSLAHAPDAGKAEDDALVSSREVLSGLVDVRRKDLGAVMVAGRDVVDDLVGLAHVGREDRGHVLLREVGLQPCGLHDQNRVSGGVRLVERVRRELEDVVPDLLRDVATVAVRLGAVHPVVVDRLVRTGLLPVEDLVGQHLDLLLCHGLAHARV